MKVLISAPYMQPAIDRFRPIFAERGIELLVPPVSERLEEQDLLRWVGDIDGAICGDDRFTERVLRAAPRLRVIAKWGTGIDSIDRDACARLGIALCNTPNAFSEPVADTVLGYMLCFARKLPWMDRLMRDGSWGKIPSVSLRECTLGIVGVGNVGGAVARRAAGFGMRIVGCDPVPPPAELRDSVGMTMADLPTLLREADFVSINCDLNPSSRHLMSAAAFAQMRPGAVLINTARGPIVDEPALVAALQAGQIGGAALDVFEDEPLPADSPLRGMDNVLLAPHNSNSSPLAWERVHMNTIRNLLNVLTPDRSEL
ncbi:phosphoglycerate dehydrogenase [Oscillochloris sp. ZM17-4]|uniref:phosphoglycerate dehydrogenase n=1 Tax=Oscillochloris sp. ZM17-4 TaxID=2866714 RepID=UPI001C73AE29|nr:phosphoglycerate dehydrogenase [Oscillochloris sp. ZM17-4]MBX0331025.1 phosphoglycerate dehydrogenase [Oscillochloris sp. ZM17-4]